MSGAEQHSVIVFELLRMCLVKQVPRWMRKEDNIVGCLPDFQGLTCKLVGAAFSMRTPSTSSLDRHVSLPSDMVFNQPMRLHSMR